MAPTKKAQYVEKNLVWLCRQNIHGDRLQAQLTRHNSLLGVHSLQRAYTEIERCARECVMARATRGLHILLTL